MITPQYCSFSQSLETLNKSWTRRDHPRRGRWPELRMKDYGNDAPQALMLGGGPALAGSADGSSAPEVLVVQHQSARTVEDWSGQGTAHSFPYPDDVVRIGVFHELGAVRTVLLWAKACFERFFVHELQGFRTHGTTRFFQCLGNRSVDLLARVRQYAPPVDELFQVLERHRALEGYDREGLDAMVGEIWSAALYSPPLDSPDVCALVDRSRATRARILEASADLRYVHRVARAKHLAKTQELGDYSLLCESARLRNANVRLDYERAFGALEVALTEQCHRYNRASRRVTLKTQRPHLSQQELAAAVAEMEAAEAASLAAMRERVAEAAQLHREALEGSALQPELHKQLIEEAKQILRTLKFLLAPDRLAHDQNYQRLSPERQAELTELMREVFQIRSEELGHPKGFLERDLRMPQVLAQILEQVKMILECPELELDPWLLPPEGPLEEQLAWYQKLGGWLDREIDACRQELHLLVSDPSVREQERALTGDVASIQRDLEAKATEFRERADALEQELGGLFDGYRKAAH